MNKIAFLLLSLISVTLCASAPADKKELAEKMQPWSSTAKKRLIDGLAWSLNTGKTIPDYRTNGAFIVLSELQSELDSKEPHESCNADLALKFLKQVSYLARYSVALKMAKEKYKAGLAAQISEQAQGQTNEAEDVWKDFRVTVARELTEYIEERSRSQREAVVSTGPRETAKTGSLIFNKGPENIKDMFTKNHTMTPYDAANLKAATLSLYALWDVSECEKKYVRKD